MNPKVFENCKEKVFSIVLKVKKVQEMRKEISLLEDEIEKSKAVFNYIKEKEHNLYKIDYVTIYEDHITVGYNLVTDMGNWYRYEKFCFEDMAKLLAKDDIKREKEGN